jgi:hypothetical protein
MLSVTPSQLLDLLKRVAPARPIFIWGAPGIGKSALVEQYAASIGLTCVSLLGSQLAPEDLIGVPQIVDGKSRFFPPALIARDAPYVLFLDELNACTPEVQKAFYSLIHDRRIGEYHLPKGSVVIGAGNRKQDRALARPIASALVNRLIHVELQANTQQWLSWAKKNGVHELILGYVRSRPDHLLAPQAQDDAPFSTPRSWHMLSDALHSYRTQDLTPQLIQVLASGCLSANHAGQFCAFARNYLIPHSPEDILSGKESIPYSNVEEATFMLASVRAYLIEKLPSERQTLEGESRRLLKMAHNLVEKTAHADAELLRYFITPENEDQLPEWFVQEVTDSWASELGLEEDPPARPFGRGVFGRAGASPLGGSRSFSPSARSPFGPPRDDDSNPPASPFGRRRGLG